MKKFAIGAASVLVAVAVLFAADFALNAGKIYPGVTVSGIDVSGMTPEQAASAIAEKHSSAFSGNSVRLFADQDTFDRASSGEDVFSEIQLDEETMGSQCAWRIDSESLRASFDPMLAAQAALAVGRGDGGFPARFSAMFNGRDIPVRVTFNEEVLEGLASRIDAYAGDPRVDCDIAVEDGVAYAVEGHDGMMVDREVFANAISAALLNPDCAEADYVAQVVFTPMRIDLPAAQKAADRVNASIAHGVEFAYGDQVWHAFPAECGEWVVADPVLRDGAWVLEPGIDVSVARAQLRSHVLAAVGLAECRVSFEQGSDGISVNARAQGQIPMLEQALTKLPAVLFDEGSERSSAPVVEVPSADVPPVMTFDEAVDMGVIMKISSFTTEYTDDYPSRNHNIHLMADYLDGSIAKAHSDWSMLGTSGEISEKTGYQAASQIVDGELVDDFGGGVCQVATTVFNAVYEAGFPVPVRHNHSLYMSSYPDGRDAAIAWSYLDLIWSNDTDSDVLVRARYTDTDVTIELWGVDPGYSVESEVGEWSKGADFKVKVKFDPSLSETEIREDKKGRDGSSITVTRVVYASDGSVLREDAFNSTYDPVNRIVTVKGDGDSKVMTQDEFKAFIEKREADRLKEEADSKAPDSPESAESDETPSAE